MFFIPSRLLREVEEVKKVCRNCPVRKQCLDYAVKYNEYGIWGGTTEEERPGIVILMRVVASLSLLPSNTQDVPSSPMHVGQSYLSNTSYQGTHNQVASPSASVLPFQLSPTRTPIPERRFVLEWNLDPPDDRDRRLSG